MKEMDNLIQKLKSLFQYKRADKKETAYFKEFDHDQICASVHKCIEKIIGEHIKIEDIHGLQEAGVDLIIDDSESKVGLQVKSYNDIANSDNSFSGTVKRQIQDPKKHSLEHLFILLCGDTNNRSQNAKINGLKSEISQMNDNYISVISPEYLIQLVKSPEAIKIDLSTVVYGKANLTKKRTEIVEYLNSNLYIERSKGYSLINDLIDLNIINNALGKKLFEIFKRDVTTEEEQSRIINILQRGRYFSIRNALLQYWLEKRKLSGPFSNYFSVDVKCLETLLDVLESKDINEFPGEIIFYIFVAIRTQVNYNNAVKKCHFAKIKNLIENKWYQKNDSFPIIGEIYEKITGIKISEKTDPGVNLQQKKARDRKLRQTLSQTIKGDNNIQIAGDMINIVTSKAQGINFLPPIDSIGGDPLLKQAIKTRFNQIGEEREKRFGKSAYSVMYRKFKKDFGIKNNAWTIIWTWPKECAKSIIEYLDDKFSNTIQGRIERAAKKEGYLHSRKYLYKREKELLEHLDLTISSIEVKNLLSDYFGVQSHTQLSHLQHWQWVCYLEGQVEKIEGS